jgi:hypothetical protein
MQQEHPPFDGMAAFHRLCASARRSPAQQAALEWVLDELRQQLTPKWVSVVLASDDPLRTRLVEMTFKPHELISMLEFVIRLKESNGASGAAQLRRAVRTDRQHSDFRHAELMLEVSALASALGATTAFEVLAPGYSNPVDLVVTVDNEPIPIECRVLLLDEAFRQRQLAVDRLLDTFYGLATEYDGAIVVRLHRVFDDCDALSAAIRRAINASKQAGASIVEVHDDLEVRVDPPGSDGRSLVEGPPIGGDTWRRAVLAIGDKGAKAYGPRPVWLRLELLNGISPLTPWSQEPSLERKAALLADEIRRSIGGLELAGVIASTGRNPHHADIAPARIRLADGTIALRCDDSVRRAREAYIVPLHELHAREASLLADAYWQEHLRLESALQRHGLPGPASLLGLQDHSR